jgi:hypothetical protein
MLKANSRECYFYEVLKYTIVLLAQLKDKRHEYYNRVYLLY